MTPAAPVRKKAAWSLHWRLAVGLVLCIGGTFGAVLPVLDHWVDREIYRRMDLTLLQRSASVARLLQAPEPVPFEHLLPDHESNGYMEFFTVFDARSGEVLMRSPSSGGATLSVGMEDEGLPRYYDVTLPNGHTGRALASRLILPGGQARLLVVAMEREGWDQTERRVHVALIVGITLATLLATVLAMLVVQRVIVLLRRTGAAAARLNADQPMQPLGGDLPRELTPFADAFNLGLRHLYTAIERERRFSRDVAHELRTPLAEIRTSAESALSVGDPAHAQQSLKAAVNAVARMQRSVDTLLLLARLESGQHTQEPDPLDLAAMMREMLAAGAALRAQRRLSVRSTLPASAWVQGDLGVIERIIANLLNNATEYAPPGDEIVCRLSRDEAGWRLCISNSAPELGDEDLACFGHRFWRKHSEGGTEQHAGLGLALAFALARAIHLPLQFRLQDDRLTATLGPWQPLL